MKNLLKKIPATLPEELFETLVQTEYIHIERIISKGHTSPEEGWHDQGRRLFALVRLSCHTGHLTLRMDFSGGTHCF